MTDRMPDQQFQFQRSDAISTSGPKFPDTDARYPVAIMKIGRLLFLQGLLAAQLDSFSPWTIKLACDGIYGGVTPKDQRELQALAEVVADSGAPLSRLGKGSTFAAMVRKVRNR